jgi:predicted RNA-binding protein with PIN domain
MRYLIDGYNLAHALGVLRGKVPVGAVELARRSLLIRLLQAPGFRAYATTVVFDAQRAPPGTPAEQRQLGVRLLFALGRQADDLIEELIEADADPRQLTVVSSDRRLREAARRRHARSLRCLEYWEAIERAPAGPPSGPHQPDAEAKPEELTSQELRDWYQRFGVQENDDDPGF